MALTGKPKATPLQVGDTAYFVNNGKVVSGTITKVVVGVSNPQADLEGVQENTYIINSQSFAESSIAATQSSAAKIAKGGYLNNWSNMASTIGFAGFSAGAGCDISNSDFTNCNFGNINVEGVNPAELDSTNLDNCNFTGCNLEAVLFTNSSLRNCIFTGANLLDAHLEGADLTGSTVPKGYEDPVDFESLVSGNVDENTTWIDGSHPFPTGG